MSILSESDRAVCSLNGGSTQEALGQNLKEIAWHASRAARLGNWVRVFRLDDDIPRSSHLSEIIQEVTTIVDATLPESLENRATCRISKRLECYLVSYH